MKKIPNSVIAISLSVVALSGKEIGKDAEVAAFQKLEQLATKQMQTGVTSKSSLLKARILEARVLFVNGELSRDQWLAKEKKLNVELLQWQTHNVSENPHQNHIEKVFEFQDRLLCTRQLLKHNESSIPKNNRARIDKSEKKNLDTKNRTNLKFPFLSVEIINVPKTAPIPARVNNMPISPGEII